MRRTKVSNLMSVLGAAVFSIVVLFGVLFFAGFWTVADTYHVSAYVYNARGIAQYSTVFEAGLPVGLVTGIHRDGPDAVLNLRITSGERPLPVDSQVQLGLRSLAGEADVLLDPGHSTKMVKNGGSLGLSQDQNYTEVDQILNELSGYTEDRTRRFFQAAGYGLNGEGQNLNQTLGGFARLVNNSPPVTSTLGYQHQQVADLVQNFGTIMSAIGQRTRALDEFARGARETFNAVAARDQAFHRFLGAAPKGIYNAGHGTHELGVIAPDVTPVLNNLTQAVQRLTPVVDVLTPASNEGINVVNALGGASPALRNLIVGLERLQPSASKALPAVHALTCQLDPMLSYISPYGRDLGAFFENFGGADSPYDHNHQLLASILVNPTEEYRGIENQPESKALQTLFNLGIFSPTNSAGNGYDPLPLPGGMDGHVRGLGNEGPADFGATHKYPQIKQACVS
jgi:phospholipid/cholesterol/gamma-HCH transport system substrate-binding protein